MLESQDAQCDGCGQQEGARRRQTAAQRDDVRREPGRIAQGEKEVEQASAQPKAVKTVVENWDRLTANYDFPREHWKHLRTSNVVESPSRG